MFFSINWGVGADPSVYIQTTVIHAIILWQCGLEFLFPIYARLLSPADFGTQDLVLSVVNILVLFLILGMDSAVMQNYYECEEIEKKTKLFKQQIDKLEKTGKENPEKAIELTNKIKERLKNFRQAGLDKDGEYSLENLAFKDLRNTGYLEKLSNLKNSFIDKS